LWVGTACIARKPATGRGALPLPYEVSYAVLSRLRESGPPAWALRAESLRRALPISG
jgi:hypothetical protein